MQREYSTAEIKKNTQELRHSQIKKNYYSYIEYLFMKDSVCC